MTPLRRRYTDDLRLHNYAPRTIDAYVARVALFARRFGLGTQCRKPLPAVRAFPRRMDRLVR